MAASTAPPTASRTAPATAPTAPATRAVARRAATPQRGRRERAQERRAAAAAAGAADADQEPPDAADAAAGGATAAGRLRDRVGHAIDPARILVGVEAVSVDVAQLEPRGLELGLVELAVALRVALPVDRRRPVAVARVEVLRVLLERQVELAHHHEVLRLAHGLRAAALPRDGAPRVGERGVDVRVVLQQLARLQRRVRVHRMVGRAGASASASTNFSLSAFIDGNMARSRRLAAAPALLDVAHGGEQRIRLVVERHRLARRTRMIRPDGGGGGVRGFAAAARRDCRLCGGEEALRLLWRRRPLHGRHVAAAGRSQTTSSSRRAHARVRRRLLLTAAAAPVRVCVCVRERTRTARVKKDRKTEK